MIHQGDALTVLKCMPAESFNCVVTSPPYFGLRDYGMDDQIGNEETPEEYVQRIVEVFHEVKRVLRSDGTLWLNLGDSYSAGGRGGGEKQNSNKGSIGLGPWKVAGYKQKQLLGIPWKVAFALQADGWYLRQDIIWSKPNPMPESVTDRCTKAHEYVFLLSKSSQYYFDNEAIKEPTVTRDTIVRDRDNTRLNNTPGRSRMHGLKNNNYEKRNKRSVWTVTAKPFKGAHFATFPTELIEPMIRAGCPGGGLVLDPFFGAGTTGVVAKRLGRNYIGIELNPEYVAIAQKRLHQLQPTLISI